MSRFMGMRRTLGVLNAMRADGSIGRYAIAGAVAAYNYIEASVTDDLDVLIALKAVAGTALVDLRPIFTDLARRGYTEFRNEGLVIENWPVQFLPVASDLDAEALEQARPVDVTLDELEITTRTFVLGPEHLVATALRIGRPKDRLRIVQFLAEGAIDPDLLRNILERHGLKAAWQTFCASAGMIEHDMFRRRTP